MMQVKTGNINQLGVLRVYLQTVFRRIWQVHLPAVIRQIMARIERAHYRSSALERCLVLGAVAEALWLSFFDVFPPSSLIDENLATKLAILFLGLAGAHIAVLAIDGTAAKKYVCAIQSAFWTTWTM